MPMREGRAAVASVEQEVRVRCEHLRAVLRAARATAGRHRAVARETRTGADPDAPGV